MQTQQNKESCDILFAGQRFNDLNWIGASSKIPWWLLVHYKTTFLLHFNTIFVSKKRLLLLLKRITFCGSCCLTLANLAQFRFRQSCTQSLSPSKGTVGLWNQNHKHMYKLNKEPQLNVPVRKSGPRLTASNWIRIFSVRVKSFQLNVQFSWILIRYQNS